MSKRIPITKGKHTTVDEIDYEWAMQWKWYCLTPSQSKNHKYAQRCSPHTINGKRKSSISLHRAILERKIGRTLLSHETPDHINGNGLDNRRCNLRPASAKENARNRRGCTGGKSRFKGVFLSACGTWVAQICVDYKRIPSGTWIEEEEAARGYDWFAIHYFGEFARPNFQDIRPPKPPTRLKYYSRLKRMFRTQVQRAGTGLRCGAMNPCAKLTESQVLEIRRRYARGGITQRELGDGFDCSVHTVYDIIHRKSWKHLPQAMELREVANV